MVLRLILLMLALAAAVCPPAVRADALRPVAVDRFFVTPSEKSTLRWTVLSDALEGPVEYTVRDYWGRTVASGQAKVSADGVAEAAVKLAQGYYDLELPGTKQRFGIVALPAAKGRLDPFFAVDAAMSWLVRDDALRDGLVKVLRRSGIGMSRERMTWRAVHPADGKYDWEAPVRFEKLRRAYAAEQVEVLEMFHDSPAWMGLVGKYPDNLVAAARSWQTIGRRWQDTWGALDVWNEPDIFFGANLPADQYVPLVKTIAWAFDGAEIKTPLVGGVMAHCNRRYLDCAARNGMLDSVDAVSFHTYGHAPQMEELIGKYRAWLRSYGRESMPLWITECGRPWRRGPDRPPTQQDADSAVDITMKAVEARAGGIARYFAFVYPFYEERQNNFGMMGRRGTPLRSMAAYARAASVLSGKQYLGDLACDDKAVRRARVFGDRRQTVAVVYTGRPDGKQTVRLGLPVVRLEGIDGRALKPTAGGAVPAGDGLVYAWLERGKLGDRLRTDTPAMRLWKIAQEKPPRRPAPSPIVLRFQFDAKLLEAKSEGYGVRAGPPEKLPLRVRAFNLSDRPQELTLKVAFSQAEARTAGPVEKKVNVAAGSFADVAWEADIRAALAATGRLGVTVTATGKTAGRVLPLHVDLAAQATSFKGAAGASNAKPLPYDFGSIDGAGGRGASPAGLGAGIGGAARPGGSCRFRFATILPSWLMSSRCVTCDLPAVPAAAQVKLSAEAAAEFAATHPAVADPAGQKQFEAERAKRIAWWTDARFGMFLCWSPAAVRQLGDDGWNIAWKRVTWKQYEEMAGQFQPAQFDARKIARQVKRLGARYVMFTVKHHAGFSMWDTRQTDFNIVKTHGTDVLEPLCEALRAEGIRVGLYFSAWDWSRPEYRGAAKEAPNLDAQRGGVTQQQGNPQWPKFLDFYLAQAEELLTGYGRIDVLWVDAWRSHVPGDWASDRLWSLVRRKQPHLLLNDRWGDLARADFLTPENHVPKQDLGRPWETCYRANRGWFYTKTPYLPAKVLVRKLIECVSRNGNLLLGFPLSAGGEFDPEAVERMNEIGAWLRANGASVYGCRSAPLKATPWGNATAKPGHLYLHVYDDRQKDSKTLVLEGLGGKIVSAAILAGGQALEITARNGDAVLRLPAGFRLDPIATVIDVRVAVPAKGPEKPHPYGPRGDNAVETP